MYIGIDLGGTNIAAGIVDENGNFVEEEDNSNNDQYLELHRTFGYGALFQQCLY